MKDRPHKGQNKKDKRTNNDLQNITHCTRFEKVEFEDTKGVITNVNRTDNTMAKTKRTKGQTKIYITLHRTLRIGQH